MTETATHGNAAKHATDASRTRKPNAQHVKPDEAKNLMGASQMDKCPRCGSPRPENHPAVQCEGEVHICPDPYHASTEEGRRMLRIADR